MKKFVLFLVFISFTLIFSALTVAAQNKEDLQWFRVQSDNGEFSVEIPAKYNHVYDKDGFSTSRKSNNYQLKEMHLVNAYYEKTLLSFESYTAKKGSLEAEYEVDQRFPKEIKASEFESNNTKIKQLSLKTDDYYWVKQYLESKTHIYILTVATRNGENEVMKRFLNSLSFRADTKEKPDSNIALYSSLKVTPVVLIKAEKDKKIAADDKISTKDKVDDKSKLLIVNKPVPAYTDSARMKGVQGVIQLKTTFAEDSFIPKIEIVKVLPEGLLRQAIFAALRIKFMPEEKEGKPVAVIKTIEYNFAIY